MSTLYNQIAEAAATIQPLVTSLDGKHGKPEFDEPCASKTKVAIQLAEPLLHAICSWSGEWAAPVLEIPWRVRATWPALLHENTESCWKEIDAFVRKTTISMAPKAARTLPQVMATICALDGLDRISAIIAAVSASDLGHHICSEAQWNLAERATEDESAAIALVRKVWSRAASLGLDIESVLAKSIHWQFADLTLEIFLTRWAHRAGVLESWRPALVRAHREHLRECKELEELLSCRE